MAKKSGMAHRRFALPGNKKTGLKRTLVEQRGILRSVLNIYDDPRITAVELALNSQTPLERYSRLRRAAEDVLNAAGETSYLAKLAEEEKRSSDQKQINASILAWRDDIVSRRGSLSREGIAVQFLFVSDYLGSTFNVSEDQWNAIIAFALAWYHFELDRSGAHERIVASLQSSDNLATGSRTRAQIKAAKLEVLLAICDEKIWKDQPKFKNNAHWASQPTRFHIINAELSSRGQEISKTPAGLEKLIQEAIRRAGRREIKE